jgi:lysozyme family protein
MLNRTPQYYKQLFDTMVVNTSIQIQAKQIADKIKQNISYYQQISNATSVPTNVIGIIHNMECGLNLNEHLHNGDPLTSKTIHYPSGRPLTGTPPFTFKDSAIDALKFDEFDKIKDWSIENTLLTLERYNGAGYANLNVNSPYLWSGCQHYTSGKFVEIWDVTRNKYVSHYDTTLVSKQIGGAVILKLLQ